MKKLLFVFTTGFALFSMFFGAGNLVYPLSLGLNAQDQCLPAIGGFLITAVGVPMLGFLSMMLFQGQYRVFFQKIGALPGFFLIAATLCVMGPFGALPRCIALSYAAVNATAPLLSLEMFSLLAVA